jgi:hypothetical protein
MYYKICFSVPFLFINSDLISRNPHLRDTHARACTFKFVHSVTCMLRYIEEVAYGCASDLHLWGSGFESCCKCRISCVTFLLVFLGTSVGPAGTEPLNMPQWVFFQITSDLFNMGTLAYHSMRRNPPSWYSVIEMCSSSIHPSVQRCTCKLPWEWQEV